MDYELDEKNLLKEKLIKYFRNLISRVLISIILVLSLSILIKLDTKYISLIDKYFFTDNLEFTKINNWYNSLFGNVLPQIDTEETLVFSSNDLKTYQYSDYLDGVKIHLSKNSPVSILMGGIVVFNQEYEGFGSTIIVQGNDGINYYYTNLTNITVNLYDYLDKDTLIGVTNEDYLYLILEKNGEYVSYESLLQ